MRTHQTHEAPAPVDDVVRKVGVGDTGNVETLDLRVVSSPSTRGQQ